MARHFDGASNDWLDSNSNSEMLWHHDFDFLWSAWIKFDDYTQDTVQIIMANNGTSSNNKGWGFWFENRSGVGTGSQKYLRMLVSDGGGITQQITSNDDAITDNNWHHVAVACDGTAANGTVWVDGVDVTNAVIGTGTTGSGNTTTDTFISTYTAGGGLGLDGSLADMGGWNGHPGDDKIAALAAGVAPTAVGPLPDFYRSFVRDLNAGGIGLPAMAVGSGTDVLPHPRIIYPAPHIIPAFSSAAAKAHLSALGLYAAPVMLANGSFAGKTAAGGLKDIAAAPDGVGTTTLSMGAIRDLSAATDGAATTTADMVAARGVSAAADGVATTTAALEAWKFENISATAAGAGVATLSMAAIRDLSAAADGVAAVTSVMPEGAQKSVSATAAGAGTATVTIQSGGAQDISATAAGVGSTTVTFGAIRDVSAAADGAAAVSISMGTLDHVSATSDGAATAAADSFFVIRSVDAAPAGVATATAALTKLGQLRALLASAAGIAAITADMTEVADVAGIGKYAPEHAGALSDLQAAKGFSPDHAGALSDLTDAGV